MLRRTRGGGQDRGSRGTGASFDDSGPDSTELDAEVASWVASERLLLGSVLLDSEVISADHLNDVLRVGPGDRRRIGEQLMQRAGVTEQQIADGLARQFGIRGVDLSVETPDQVAIDMIGEAMSAAARHPDVGR